MTHNIFLSYSCEDADLMNRLKDDFEQIGFTVWTDANIQPGSPSWKVTIEQAIRDADCVVVVFSPSASQSKWVRAELDFSEAQEKSIFPVLAKGTSANAVPLGYSSHQWIDLREEKSYNEGLIRLAEVIAHHIQVTPFGLTILKRNIQPTATNIDGLPLRFLVPFILAVAFVGFVGLMALSNNQQSNNDDGEQTAEVTEIVPPTDAPVPNADSTAETLAPTIEQETLDNDWTRFSNGRVQIDVPAGWINATDSGLFDVFLDTLINSSGDIQAMLDTNTIQEELVLTTGLLSPNIAIATLEFNFAINLDTLEGIVRSFITTPDSNFVFEEIQQVEMPQGEMIYYRNSLTDESGSFLTIGYAFLDERTMYLISAIVNQDNTETFADEVLTIAETFQIVDGE